ncbi:plasmid replication, integration and excision activator [Actinomadura madurae]|uniref:plasmid replication, integration and excision activator n=1 Tax=Actinomadura madurae TaxID=1993 RepID=UPI0020D206AF|nr:plasmid replication, integration and excision activator [Actinomadura madurae]MCP9949334.1 plasmid replication, integration and excision activator [Actinomadura madurae]MCP9966091.1 plasmid replication, integration and excision activator [Actinomadura madurae]MCP9978576.1 plasmid replication, integration and excision activator [Actinomadura madurae]MCQ0009896.1 plasmid replication, integration and excision activator [Actinomadura madurae]MCQ0014779.1 plasmid replication, integration and exc
MAVQGPFKVSFGDVFPFGAFIKGGVEPVRDFDRSTRENFVQARDKESGELVWAVEVLDADPESKGTFKVKLMAPVQPVMPEAPAGFPFVPVEFDGLAVTPYVNSGTGRLAYSLKAAAVRPANFKGGNASRTGKDNAAKDAA